MTCNILNHYRQKYLEAQKKPMKEEVKRTGLAKQYWWQMIQLLPTSYNQKRTVMLNYEVLANMYKSRRNHKLDEWHTLCDWIEGLPYSELITGIDWKKANPILHAERDENGNLLREMKKAIDPAERVSDTSKAMTNIMDKLIASRGKRSEIPGIVDDNIGCNEGLNKHFGGVRSDIWRRKISLHFGKRYIPSLTMPSKRDRSVFDIHPENGFSVSVSPWPDADELYDMYQKGRITANDFRTKMGLPMVRNAEKFMKHSFLDQQLHIPTD